MEKYGLLGASLKHSFSQAFFSRKFSDESIEACYINFELPDIALLPDVIRSNPELRGLNVTIPYKRLVMPLLDHIDPAAIRIGAVNTIALTPDRKLLGFNTDYIGFRNSIMPLLPERGSTKALVLGTGGASAAVSEALLGLGVEPTLVSRTPGEGRLTYADLTPEIVDSHRIVVNTTPLGTWPDDGSAPAFPYHLLSAAHICHDLVYNPPTTRFMTLCSERGAVVKNGHDMLVGQALASWDIWQNHRG